MSNKSFTPEEKQAFIERWNEQQTLTLLCRNYELETVRIAKELASIMANYPWSDAFDSHGQVKMNWETFGIILAPYIQQNFVRKAATPL